MTFVSVMLTRSFKPFPPKAQRTAEYVLQNFQIDAVYSSDLSRAMDTARPIAKALSFPIHPDRRLREIYLGNWQGRLIEEVKRDEEYIQWQAGLYEGNEKETRAELLFRANEVIHEIALKNDNKNVLLSTHGGVVNALLREWLNLQKTDRIKFPGNASISVVNYDIQSKSADILLMGYDGHLNSEGA